MLDQKARTGQNLRISGGKPLIGEVAVSGAKNSVPKLMVAALLTGETCTIRNVPRIEDVDLMADLIEALGGRVEFDSGGILRISAASLRALDEEELATFAGRSRIPVLLCGPLLTRLGEATVTDLGGCRIGTRPIDFHLEALKRLGASINPTTHGYRLKTTGLRGTELWMPYPSVGATEQILFSAVKAEGETVIANAAIEPEILDLISVLREMGAKIQFDGGRIIKIEGVKQLSGFSHTAMVDRLEVCSWACAAIATNGRILVRKAADCDLKSFLASYVDAGGAFRNKGDGIEFERADATRPLQAVTLETGVHPGFMTDWQPPFVVALTQAEGVSTVHETVYEDRFGYVAALNKMGAGITLHEECLGGYCRFGSTGDLHSAVVTGPTRLNGTQLDVIDLRAGFSLIIGALTAEGDSLISNVQVLRRGYEDLFDKLVVIGAEVSLED